jgi:micrococcal nuclease
MRIVVVAAAVLLAACGAAPSAALRDQVGDNRQPAVVTQHVDGDTLWVQARGNGPLPSGEEHKIRLLEIDTPEVGDMAECYGEEAAAYVQRVLPVGTAVSLEADREDTDQYGRFLRYVWTADGEMINERVVREGFARSVLFEPNDAYIDRMREAEADARGAGRGMWGACPGSHP